MVKIRVIVGITKTLPDKLLFTEKKRYEDVWFNVISITRGWPRWVGVNFPEKSVT